jgi:tetratricopeptide (TPR) repeat protein
VVLLHQGLLDLAQEKLEEALTLDPENIIANNFTAFLAFRRGNVERAREYCNRVLAVDPAVPLTLLMVGRMDEAIGEKSLAAESYLKAAEAGRASTTAAADGGLAIAAHSRYLRALLLREMRRHDEALADLNETLDVFPSNLNALYEKGLAQLELGRDAEAAETLQSVNSEGTNWVAPEAWLFPVRRYLFLEENAHYWRGVALQRAGRPNEAVQELEPLVPLVESRIGSDLGSSSALTPDAQRVLEGELDLSYYDTHFVLARLYHGMDDRSQAKQTLRGLMKVEGIGKARKARAKELLQELR